jgi:tripeptidyl-peptidase I
MPLFGLLFLISAAVKIVDSTSVSTFAPTHIVHEHTPSDPNWAKVERAPPNAIWPVRVGMIQSNLQLAAKILYEMYDINVRDEKSRLQASVLLTSIDQIQIFKYGQWYSAEDARDLFAPQNETLDALKNWIEAEGFITSVSANKQWLQFDASTRELEHLLQAEYYIYQHNTEPSERAIGCDHYSLPENIQKHVDYITPASKKLHIDGQPRKIQRKNRSRPSEPGDRISMKYRRQLKRQNCSEIVSPDCIRGLYNISLGTLAIEGNDLALYETQLQRFSQQDFNDFAKVYASFMNDTVPIYRSINGGKPQTNTTSMDGGEVMLDFDIAWPIIYPQKIIVYEVDDEPYERHRPRISHYNSFFDALDGSYCNRTAFGEAGDDPQWDPIYPHNRTGGYHHPAMCGVYKPSNVISFSYVFSEEIYPVYYQRRQCSEVMKLALQGVSIFVGSGDWGMENIPFFNGPDRCPVNLDGTERFAVLGMCSCPFVTCVGGTMLPKGVEPLPANEVVWNDHDLATGGGFSNIFPRPPYQNSTIDGWLKDSPPPYESYATTYNESVGVNGGRFNRIGRAYPDVAALADNLINQVQGGLSLGSGTSASTPLWAAIATRINTERLNAGKSTVGFLNPALYKNAHRFLNDVQEGHAFGCGTEGFQAVRGWDPVTGLGTPDYGKLLDYFMSLP